MIRLLFFMLGFSVAINVYAQTAADTLIPYRLNDTTWGYKNGAGEIAIATQYSYAGRFTSGYAVVTSGTYNNQYSSWIIDTKGNAITPKVNGQYTILEGTPPVFAARTYRPQQQFVYDTSGNLLASCTDCNFSRAPNRQHIQTSPYSMGSKDTLIRIIDLHGTVIYTRPGTYMSAVENGNCIGAPGYHPARLPYNYVEPVGSRGRRAEGVLLRADYTMVFDSMTEVPHFSNGKGVISRHNSAAFVDSLLQPIIPFSAGYSSMFYWCSGYLAVQKDSLFGVLDLNGNVVRPCIYPAPLHPEDSGFVFRMYCSDCGKGGRYQDIYFLRNGDTLISNDYYLQSYNNSTSFRGPLTVKHKKTGKYGIITYDKSVMIPCRYDALGQMTDNRALFFRGDTAGLIDAQGKEVLEFWFPCEAASAFSDGRALCAVLLPGGRREYPTAQIISDGKTVMARRFVWIDTSGQIINRQSFDWVTKFRDGYSMVINNGEQYLVDTSLQRVMIAGKYFCGSYFSNGYVVIGDGKKWGLADSTGKVVIPVQYDAIAVREDGPGGISLMDRYGRGDSSYGHIIVPDIIDGRIVVTKGKKEEVLPVPGMK